MTIHLRKFRPSIVGTAITIVLLPALIAAGFWQLGRAQEKLALLNQLRIGAEATQQFSASSANDIPNLQYVTATGRFDGAHQIFLDNMPSSRRATSMGQSSGGLPGYHVLTPLRMGDGFTVLVNRGWLPLGRTRDELPDIRIDDRVRTLRGVVTDPQRPGIRLGNSAVSQGSWPLVLNFPSAEQLASLYGKQFIPKIILLDASEADGFERDWSSRLTFGDFGPDKHRAYAIQWFGLAFTLVVIYFVVSIRRSNADIDGQTS